MRAESRFLPDRSSVVVSEIIERRADLEPGGICAVFEDGAVWSWAQARDEGRRAAANLAADGVRRGDRVLVFQGNGPDWLRAWWGISQLGAVLVPVHTAYQGEMLQHVCTSSKARLSVVATEFVDQFAGLDNPPTLADPTRLITGRLGAVRAPDPPVLEPWDLQSINYTSGTTGPAKGVLTPYLHLWAAGEYFFARELRLSPADRWLVDLPLFHVAPLRMCVAAWSTGASVAVRSGFAGRDYWSSAKDCGATLSLLVGTMANFLDAQPPSPSERTHGLRCIGAAPLVANPIGFRSRFNIEFVSTAYGSTETHVPTVLPWGEEPPPGSCGKVAPNVEIRLVDGHDVPVAEGEAGEMIVRTALPWMMNAGYDGRPDATAEAWRNGWFHTGDIFRCDDAGHFYFVDRAKDALRRRGENISSFEVEREVLAYPGVVDAACVAAPAEFGEDEVKVFVVTDGGDVSFPDLIDFLSRRMPSFMLPRYLERVDELPRTATMRVQKHLLRGRPAGPGTWDRAHRVGTSS
jgi:carnitine-CoA ligase